MTLRGRANLSGYYAATSASCPWDACDLNTSKMPNECKRTQSAIATETSAPGQAIQGLFLMISFVELSSCLKFCNYRLQLCFLVKGGSAETKKQYAFLQSLAAVLRGKHGCTHLLVSPSVSLSSNSISKFPDSFE